MVWFSLAEFIPRGGSSLALLLFMSKRSHQASRKEIRKRYLGSEDGRVTLSSLSSAKIISSGLEHSSMSSVNGTLLDNVSLHLKFAAVCVLSQSFCVL